MFPNFPLNDNAQLFRKKKKFIWILFWELLHEQELPVSGLKIVQLLEIFLHLKFGEIRGPLP